MTGGDTWIQTMQHTSDTWRGTFMMSCIKMYQKASVYLSSGGGEHGEQWTNLGVRQTRSIPTTVDFSWCWQYTWTLRESQSTDSYKIITPSMSIIYTERFKYSKLLRSPLKYVEVKEADRLLLFPIMADAIQGGVRAAECLPLTPT